MNPQYKINNQINAPELRVIGDAEENLGVLALSEALKLAREKGLDLIEISPGAKPPVARIISYDKFRYQQEKKIKKQQAAQQKGGGHKRIQISIREAKNDLMIKMKRLEEFLAEGHQVEIALNLRGREKGNRDFARTKLDEFLKMIVVPHQIVSAPKPGGYGFTAIVAKK